MCKIENPLKPSLILMILSLSEGPDRKKHINSLCFFDDLEFAPGIRGSTGSGVICYGWDLPSTRAGGQDDVSSKQTPSNNMIIYIYIYNIIYGWQLAAGAPPQWYGPKII